jgi:ribosomal protein S18 acetylase RimI-like enzyme
MQISFREYTESDKDGFIKLKEKMQDYMISIDPLNRFTRLPGFGEININEALEAVQKQNGKVLLAVDQDVLIGFIIGVVKEQSAENLLEVIPTKLGIILDLYVEEEYRGQKIGYQLLEQMETYLKENGCDTLWLDVFSPNVNAHEFYKKFGFIDREIAMLKKIN